MTQNNYIRLLEETGRREFSRAGSKGANLGKMIRAGLPVPEGFVLLTSAYFRFVEANGLQEEIEKKLAEVDEEQLEAVKKISLNLQALFEESEIPRDLIDEIDYAYEAIGHSEVAVRSSATAEDLPGTSFAGQYSTFLNVKGKEELYQSVKKCWASLWNFRAITYRIKQNIPDKDLAHGVVVQKMIDAEKSGILFTANPVNGRRDQMLLNASWGLGEAIVGGEVTPDQWILDKNSQTVIEERIACKEVMTVLKGRGITLEKVPDNQQEQLTLDSEEVSRLQALGKQVEAYFGSPQDIEWSCKAGQVFLVQTRPITSLYPLPELVDKQKGIRIYVNFSLVSQGMQEPFTPMGESVFLKTFLAPAQITDRKIKDERDLWWCQSVGGRIFIDYTEFLRDKKQWKNMIENDLFSDQEPLTAKALQQWLEKNEEAITAYKSKILPFILKKIIPLFKIAWPMITATLYGTLFPVKARERAIYEFEKVPRLAKEERKKLQTIEDKVSFIESYIGAFMIKGFSTLAYVAPSYKNMQKAQKIAGRYLEDLSDFRLVEKSLPHNPTTEMGLALMEIAKKLDESGQKVDLEEENICKFLDKYGHRSNQEVDIGIPRWKEEPRYVLDLIQGYINNQTYQWGLDSFYSSAEEANTAIKRIADKLQQVKGRRKAKQVEHLLRHYREVSGLREYSKFALTQLYEVCRELLIEIGEELKEEGRLNEAMDIFFVRYTDIRSGKNLHETVESNKEAYNRYYNIPAPRLLASTGESIFAAGEEKEGTLSGVPVSAGTYEGKARVLHSPEEGAKLEKGEVLVTKGTNPAWTPLFLNLGAIIMETGGPISHGAVVAREYGVPAVVGVGNATEIIKDGQKVRVNGESGQVELLD